MKIKYIAYVASSIDGRIAKKNNSDIDWTSKEDSEFYQNSLKKVDVVIVGHNTYRLAGKRNWKDAIVLTSKFHIPKVKGNITFFNPKRYDLKKLLQERNYKKVAIIGGSKVYDFCLRNKMMDEIFVTIEPYIFTNGISMFSGSTFKKYKLHLHSIKVLNKKKTVLLRYLIKR